LGDKPVLPKPAGVAAKRGRALFEEMLSAARKKAELVNAPPPAHVPVRSDRRYDIAWSLVAALDEETHVDSIAIPEILPEDEVTQTFSAETLEDSEATELLERPPVGAAAIRASPPAPPPAAAIDQDLLEQAATGALLIAEDTGDAKFELTFRDELFADEVACTITMRDGAVLAEFHAADAHTRRLLEAEAGRLRAKLQDRGLRVEEVLVKDIS